MLKNTIIIGLLVLTSACGSLQSIAKPFTLSMNPPEGPYNYQKGWKDGCQSAVSATTTDLNMSLGTFKFVLDNQLRSDVLYNRAWQYAYNHCGFSMRSLSRYGV